MAKRVKTRSLQEWVGHFEPKFQGKGVVPGEYFLVSTKLDTFCYPAVGVSQTLRRSTRNGITELSQTAPPIFGWSAITLGTGPHSSFIFFVLRVDKGWVSEN